MGKFGVSQFAKGLADLAIIIIGISAIVLAIGALLSIEDFDTFLDTGITSIKNVFNSLAEIALPLAGFTALITVLGFMTPATILSGIAGFALIVGGLELILVAAGALNENTDIAWFVEQGGELLISMAEICGKIGGALVKGFIDKATESFGVIGQHLSEFMINMQPFFNTLEGVDQDSLAAINILAKSILAITAAEVLNGIFSWFAGESSLAKFGQDLAEFAPYFKEYSNRIKGINSKVVEASAKAALALAEFADKLPRKDGLAQMFAGSVDLVGFAQSLPELGANLKEYSVSVEGLKADVVENSAKAATSIAEFADKLPKHGGLAQVFTGDNNLEEFGRMLPEFGLNLKDYADNVAGLDSSVVENSTNAAKSISELAENLPNSGGIASWFTGDNKLSDFGYEMAQFGATFKTYYDYVREISTSTVNSITSSVGSIVDLAVKIKENGVTSTINNFADELSWASGKFSNFFSNTQASNIGWDFGWNLANSMAKAISHKTFPKIQLEAVQTGEVVGSYKLSAYAEGGFPEDGIFFANHNELVGGFSNGKTAVANNEQIVQGIQSGVFSGMMSALRNADFGSNITIEAHEDTDGLLNFISFKQRQKDRQFN